MLLRFVALATIFLLAISSPGAQRAIDRASIAAMFRDGMAPPRSMPIVEINPTDTSATEAMPDAVLRIPLVELNPDEAAPPSVEVLPAPKPPSASTESMSAPDARVPVVEVNPGEAAQLPSVEVLPEKKPQNSPNDVASKNASPSESVGSARPEMPAATFATSRTLSGNYSSTKELFNTAQPIKSQPVSALPQFNRDDIESAWLDLRQVRAQYSKTQVAPDWVEAITLVPPDAKPGVAPKTVFRIRLSRPRPELKVLLFRLFFDDNSTQRPTLVAWDESGTQIIQSKPLGLGINLPSSETVMIPMLAVSTIDIEVPGDGTTVRGAYLDWMKSNETFHPLNAQQRDGLSEPFAAAVPLRPPETDTELFGAVTATLAAEPLSIGPSVQKGASFQFGLEEQPLLALLSFEVANTKVEEPPEVYLNGEDIGPVILALPDLADPGYRGEMTSFVRQMHFAYTGWLRAQKLVPVDRLKVGTNDLLVISGTGTAASAIRATQIQLKYLWDKFDYILRPER